LITDSLKLKINLMGIKYNGVDVTSLTYNGNTVNELVYNGSSVYTSAPAGEHYAFNTSNLSASQIDDINAGNTVSVPITDTTESIRFSPATFGLQKEFTVEPDGTVFFPGHVTANNAGSPAQNSINLLSNKGIGEEYTSVGKQVPKSGSIWFKPNLGLADGLDHSTRSQYLLCDSLRINGYFSTLNNGILVSMEPLSNFASMGSYDTVFSLTCYKYNPHGFRTTFTGAGVQMSGNSNAVTAKVLKTQLASDFVVDSWHHMAWSIDPGNSLGSIDLWLDGQYESKTTITAGLTDEERLRPYIGRTDTTFNWYNNDVFMIGGRQYYTLKGVNFHGHIGQVDVYTNKALSAAEALSIYDTQKGTYGIT